MLFDSKTVPAISDWDKASISQKAVRFFGRLAALLTGCDNSLTVSSTPVDVGSCGTLDLRDATDLRSQLIPAD